MKKYIKSSTDSILSQLAQELDDLSYDYDYFGYFDSLEVGEDREDSIMRFEAELSNEQDRYAIIEGLKGIIKECEFYDNCKDIVKRARNLVRRIESL